jgi:iron complex transport system substrate-binding protein
MMRHRLKTLLACLSLGCFVISVLAACNNAMTFTDGIGRTITLEKAPKRIVSLSPSHTENVFALGLGDRLVGVTSFCNRPEEAKEIESVGDAFNLNLEKLVALKPDLVLCAGTTDFQAQYVQDIERLGFRTYVSGPATVEEVLADILSLSKVLGVELQGERLVDDLKDRLEEVSKRVSEDPKSRPRVFFCIDQDLWTVGPGSFIDDVIEIAGGTNVISESDISESQIQYLQVSMEDLLVLDPDLIIVAIPEEQSEVLTSSPGWENLTAVKSERVVFVNPDLVSRPSLAVVEGIVELAHALAVVD